MIDIEISGKHLDDLHKDCGYSYEDRAMLLSEEMSELNKELFKLIRDERCHLANSFEMFDGRRKAIIEEMAHVYICMESVKMILCITDKDIQKEIEKKEHK